MPILIYLRFTLPTIISFSRHRVILYCYNIINCSKPAYYDDKGRPQQNKGPCVICDLSYNPSTTQQTKIFKSQQVDKVYKSNQLKPYNLLNQSAQRNRSKKGALLFQNSINKAIPVVFHPTDNVVLHEMAFSINNNYYRFIYNPNQQFNNFSIQMIVHAMDRERISRSAYRELAAICKDLLREWAIADMRQQITGEMNTYIKIIHFNFQLSLLEKENIENLEPHIDNPNIIDSTVNTPYNHQFGYI
ncbi:hypothetical protein F8M41_005680 [Gigaspora margarita]|uniref:Uncharacterized protein n=1 Tax=Gigaspora margarita TaxID=4874 RepID=A0A8H3X7Q9_GIGMA|nr:hypothetical protein F8M41_005680 [Gigaspora margarita]